MAFNINVSIRYSTFLPVLMEVMRRTDGDVLELGAGVFSTPVLHWICKIRGRKLLSIENDKKWFRFCKQYYESEQHKFLYVENWDDCKDVINKEWNVALVDHSPSGRRIEEIKQLANLTKYIVAHDSDPWKDHQYHYSTIYPLFKYKYNFDEVDHNTVLLSNFVDLKDFSVYPKPDSPVNNKPQTASSGMKNLLIYVSPEKKFSKEHDDLTKIQIDNSLEIGWKLEDQLLVTNFDYEYRGVKSIKVSDYEVFDQNRSTKIPAINQLFKDGVIEYDKIYWFHDHDAFQLEQFEVRLEKDAGFTDYRQDTWNAGSFFFKKSAEDIFLNIWELMNLRNTNEQDALTYMWQNNLDQINDRYELMNITYNMGLYNVKNNLKKAELPIKVVHFHPHKKHHLDLYRDILSDRLMTIFNKYGIR